MWKRSNYVPPVDTMLFIQTKNVLYTMHVTIELNVVINDTKSDVIYSELGGG